MHVDEGMLKCVGFIGSPTAAGFSAIGTCFFLYMVQETEGCAYLVTARHLVRPLRRPFSARIEEYPLDQTIHVRIPRKDRPPVVVPFKRGEWIPHDDVYVDLCLVPLDFREWDINDDLDVTTLSSDSICLTEKATAHFGFGLGSEIFIPSVFVGHEGERANAPIIRVGNIAAMATTPIRGASPKRPAFLIETRSLGGTSGAPVFFHVDPYRRFRRQEAVVQPGTGYQIVPYFLVGVFIGSHGGSYIDDFIVSDAAEKLIPTDADFNAGIGVALPIQLVLDMLGQKEVADMRKATLAVIEQRTGYRPTSAAKSEPRTTEGNPSHKEAFNSLVDAAAKKRPQDG